MTDPTYGPGGPVERPAAGGLAASVGPELVAGILAIVVVVALVGSRLVVTGGGGTTTPTPPSSIAATAVPTQTAPTVDRGAVLTLLSVDRNLIDQGRALQIELDPPPVVTGVVKTTFANMKVQLRSGVSAAQQLAATPAGAPVAAKLLDDVYTKLGTVVDGTDTVLLTSEATWRKAATEAVALVALLPPLDAELQALLVEPSPSAVASGSTVPSASVPPSASVAPSASVPSPSVAPSASTSATAPPTTPPPSPSASTLPPPTPSPSPGPNELLNPGFEDPTLAPWRLVLTGPAVASVAADPVNPHLPGKLAARIDISEPTTVPQWIALQQTGLTIESGAVYRVQLWARSTATRTVRIRITGPTGNLLGSGAHVFGIGPDWTSLSFDMSSFLGSDDAIFAIEVGGDTATVWVDDASLARIPPGAP